MTKSELTKDMAVRYRDGYKGAVQNLSLSQFSENLTHQADSRYDIVEVYSLESIWKREPEKVKIVVGEIEMMIPQDKAESIKRQIQGM